MNKELYSSKYKNYVNKYYAYLIRNDLISSAIYIIYI